MKQCIWLCLLFTGFTASAQFNSRYAVANAHALRIQHHRPDSLAYLLVQPFPGDTLLQVRALFRWITENISYNTAYGKRGAQKPPALPVNELFQTLDQRVAWQVLQRRTGVCEGYARLFKTLCDYAGIKCELVQGFVKNPWEGVSKKFTTNHTWNAVQLNRQWQQLDVTWASGYTSLNGQQFTRHLDENYFLGGSSRLFDTHYPEHFWWTPAHLGTLWAEYRFSPYRFTYFLTHRIQAFAPAMGIVEGRVGDTLQFSIKPQDETRTSYLTANPYDPAAILDRSAQFKRSGGSIHLQYVLHTALPHWLYVVHNDDVVLRYFVQPNGPAILVRGE